MSQHTLKRACLLAGCAFFAFASPITAETLYFFQQANQFWNNAANWFVPDPGNPGAFTLAGRTPINGTDDVRIQSGTCDATGVTFQPQTSFTVTALTTVTGGNFDVFTFNFIEPKAGTGSNGLTGTVVNIKASGAINFTIANTSLTNCIITLQGGAFVNQASLLTVNGSTIFNQGSWVLQAGTTLTFLGSASRFDNVADIRGNAGTTQIVGGPFVTINNSGTIRADSGTLNLNGNIVWLTDDGTGSFYPFTSDALININGAFVVPANTTTYFKGPGNVATQGNVTVNGTLSVGVPASGPTTMKSPVVINGAPVDPGKWLIKGNATIAGGGVIQIDENSEASVESNGIAIGPGFVGKAKILNGGKLNIKGADNNGSGTFAIFDGTFENEGTVTINVQQMDVRNCNVTNYKLIEFTAPTGIISSGSPAPVFNNEAGALWNVLAATSSNPPAGFSGITSNAPVFNNDGTLNLTGTGSYFFCQGEATGTFNLGPETKIVFGNGLFTLGGAVDIDGTVRVDPNGQVGFDVQEAFNELRIPLLELNGGRLFCADEHCYGYVERFEFTSGRFGGGFTLAVPDTGIFNFTGPGEKVLDEVTIEHSGTATWTGSGKIEASNGATWNNLTGALFSVQNNAVFDGTLENPPLFINREGATFEKTILDGTSTFGIRFENYGTVDLKIGRTNFFDFEQLGGTTLFNGGSMGTIGGTELIFGSGSCGGDGTIHGNVVIGTTVGQPVIVFGPGFSPGKITVTGNYTQRANATLRTEVAGLTTPGVDYDWVEVFGTAALGGRLEVANINGFAPSPSDTIVPLTANAISGTFDSTNSQVTYGSNSITVAALPTGSRQLLNISTRLNVGTGENALIGGFIITGSEPKRVILRAIGPSLSSQGVTGALQDPTLELVQGDTSLAFNDNWKETQQSEIEGSTIPPTNDAEAAIVRTLDPGAYTAVMRGKNDGTGVGLVELYDLNQAAAAKLANISSRGFVQTGENVLIGGFIVGGSGGVDARVVVRAIGPSLGAVGVAGALQDPTLELVDANGAVIRANDNWKNGQRSELEALSIQPTNDAEAALIESLAAGNYTAVVRGQGGSTGVGLVEVYNVP